MLAHSKWRPLPATRYVAQWTTVSRLADRIGTWRRLAERSVDANPFYEPDYLIASALHLEKDDIRCVAVFRDGAHDSDLIGLFPLAPLGLPNGSLLPALNFYQNPYVCLTVPLVDRDDPVGIWECFIERCVRSSNQPRLIHSALMPTGRDTYRALLAALAARDLSALEVTSFERASLKRIAKFDSYLDRLSTNRLKDLRRRERRLAEMGAVKFVFARDTAEKAAALDTLLMLEKSGWKGEVGTALACNPASEAFARAAFLGPRGNVAMLTLNGETIAACACLSSHRTLFTVKIAHDERFRSLGPGTLLDMQMARSLTSPETGYRRLDSCSIPGNPVEKYWLDREQIAEVAFAVTPGAGSAWLPTFVTALRALNRLRDIAKRTLAGLRRD